MDGLLAELAREGIHVQAWIGAGAHARIARCEFEGGVWALKVGSSVLIEREWRMGRELAHSALLTPRRFWAFEEQSALLMEHFDGEPIVQAVRRELAPLPEQATRQNLPMAFGYELNDLGEDAYRFCGPRAARRLAALTRPCAQALAAVHEAGLVHLDVAPENLLVRGQEARLADLGLARREGERAELAIGSAAYLAPELGQGRVSAACDWYSLGVVLFQALTGGLPFEGGGPEVLVRKQSLAAPSVDELCPEAGGRLVELVAGLLRRDPAARFGVEDVLSRCEP